MGAYVGDVRDPNLLRLGDSEFGLPTQRRPRCENCPPTRHQERSLPELSRCRHGRLERMADSQRLISAHKGQQENLDMAAMDALDAMEKV